MDLSLLIAILTGGGVVAKAQDPPMPTLIAKDVTEISSGHMTPALEAHASQIMQPLQSTIITPVSNTPPNGQVPAPIVTMPAVDPTTGVPTGYTAPPVVVAQIPTQTPTQTPVIVPAQTPTPPVVYIAPPFVPTLTNTWAPDSPAELPRAYVDTTMPDTTGYVLVRVPGDYPDLQTALNTVSLGTIIELQANGIYSSHNDEGFLFPNKTTGTGWIIIRTSAWQQLPPEGSKVDSSHAALLAKIERQYLYCISMLMAAHHYRFIGIEFRNQGNLHSDYSSAMIAHNASQSMPKTVDDFVHHIVYDRVWIHGPDIPGDSGANKGIVFAGKYEAVIDSTIEYFTAGSDSNAVVQWNGIGPTKIVHNTLMSAGENIMFGGANTSLLVPSTPADIEIRGNFVYKPLKWRDDPAYSVTTKNLWEMKNAERVLCEGNIFENQWPSGQVGYAWTWTPRMGDTINAMTPYIHVSDITAVNNIIRNSSKGIALSGKTYGGAGQGETGLGGRMYIANNLFIGQGHSDDPILIQFGNGAFDVVIVHNTWAAPDPNTEVTFTPGGPPKRSAPGISLIYGAANNDFTPMQRFVFRDNILYATMYPIFDSGATVEQALPLYQWNNNVWAGPWPTSGGYTPDLIQNNSNYLPRSTNAMWPADLNAVGFVNPQNDFRLASTSPYKGTASDGKDPGVDASKLPMSMPLIFDETISSGAADGIAGLSGLGSIVLIPRRASGSVPVRQGLSGRLSLAAWDRVRGR